MRRGWRAGAAGVTLGLASWLAAPWVSMAVLGTVDARHAARLRGNGTTDATTDGDAAGRAPAARPGMPRAWDTIPGPRPRVRGRSGAASS